MSGNKCLKLIGWTPERVNRFTREHSGEVKLLLQ